MTNKTTNSPPEDYIDQLLPWRATGRLDAADAKRVDEALAASPELRRRFALVEKERAETVLANESIEAPSAHMRDKLFARIEAMESGHTPRSVEGLLGRIVDFFDALSPRAVTIAAGFAALLIVAPIGVLMETLLHRAGSFQTASQTSPVQKGSFALVAFVPEATSAQITDLLQSHDAAIVDGPHSGGIYRVRISTKPVDGSERDRLISALSSRRDIVRFAVPSPS